MDHKTRDVLDELFAFEIGDLVYFRKAAGGILGRDNPAMHQITERRLVQCPGGIQKSYVINGHVMQEIELTAELPIGRVLTDAEADGIRDYRERTATANWSNVPSWLHETKKSPADEGDG